MCEHFARNPKKIRSNSVKIEISPPCVIRPRWQRNLGWILTYSDGFWSIPSFALCFGADNPNSRPCAELKMGRFQPDGPLRRRFFKIFPTRSGLYLNSRYPFWGLIRHLNQKTRSFDARSKNQKIEISGSRWNPFKFCCYRNFSIMSYADALISTLGWVPDLFRRILKYHELSTAFWR